MESDYVLPGQMILSPVKTPVGKVGLSIVSFSCVLAVCRRAVFCVYASRTGYEKNYYVLLLFMYLLFLASFVHCKWLLSPIFINNLFVCVGSWVSNSNSAQTEHIPLKFKAAHASLFALNRTQIFTTVQQTVKNMLYF